MVSFYSYFKNVGGGKLRSSAISVFTAVALLFTVNANAQKIAVRGTVTDENGPVIGATVIEKGNETNGVNTDIDGKYTINVPASAELVFESIGYKSQTIKSDRKPRSTSNSKRTTSVWTMWS